MSYQSIKRVLGETNLERKCRFLFGGCLLVLISASFWWCADQTEDLVYRQDPIKGQIAVSEGMYGIHLEALNTRTDEFDQVNSYAVMVEKLNDNLRTTKYSCDFITPQSISEAGASKEGQSLTEDEKFEQEVVNYFIKASLEQQEGTPAPAFRERYLPDRNRYEYYQPIYAVANVCVRCHDGFGDSALGSPSGLMAMSGSDTVVTSLRIDDLMAIAKVTLPYGPTKAALNQNRAILLAIAIVTAFLAMLASYVIVRYVIVKPLRHLRDVSDAISHGNISLRADIHTGDEFESLAVAFNRMLRHLVSIQKELRQVNADLDAKVDELAQVNMRLYEMNTVKSDFMATMSHELRTPLNSILGFSDVLESVDSMDEKQRRYVQNIQSSGRILLDMINHILDLAKIESGKIEVRLSDFGIEQIVQAQCDMARPLTEKKNIDLVAQVEPDLPDVHQDQARVQQILNNLLSNAIKFTPEGGRISVSVRRANSDRLIVEVCDTGVGIAEEDQSIIFEKFRQARGGVPGDEAMTRQFAGTGLGLSIVRELCRLLGGEVVVESELGRGSTFTVELPWILQEQPRLGSTLIEGFDEFTKPRLEYLQGRTADIIDAEPAADGV